MKIFIKKFNIAHRKVKNISKICMINTSAKAKTGYVEYTRTKYITKNEEGKNKCVYLTDEMLHIKEMGQVSGGIIELIVKNISKVSYRFCAEMINNMTGLSISGVAVWNIVQQLGKEIKQYLWIKILPRFT